MRFQWCGCERGGFGGLEGVRHFWVFGDEMVRVGVCVYEIVS